MPAPLIAHDLVRTLGGRRVLDGVSLTAAPGRRIGLIGENGVGKSTLLRLLAGVDRPDGGHVEWAGADIGFLHQELPFPGTTTIAEVLDDALREARHDLAELDRLAALLAEDPGIVEEYGERLERAELHGAWDADRRAAVVLDGLGLGDLAHSRPVDTLSGGQRGRLGLAALLVRRPAALLLDEPTNHLDDAAAAFLEEYLRSLPGVLVVAGHDRAFLDAVCTDLVDLDPALGGPTRYGGGYSAYQEAKRAERLRWEERFEAEQEELRELRFAARVTAHRVAHDRPMPDRDKMGYGRRGGRVERQVSSRVRNATRQLADLERDQVRKPPAPLRFRAPALAAASAEGLLVSARGLRVPGRLTLDRLDLTAQDRLLVTGPNGSGKSTLLAVLAGTLPAEGDVRRRRRLRVGLLAQDVLFDRPDRTVERTWEAELGPDAVSLASLGLLAPASLGTRVGDLSVGQRRRLALALLIANPPELLLLDEPTNHLSPRLADELEEALGTGPGAVVVASHDRWLRRRWAGRELALSPA